MTADHSINTFTTTTTTIVYTTTTITYCSNSSDKSLINVDRDSRLHACIRKNGMMNFNPQPTSLPS